jgi:hypothetical protein
VTDVVPDEPVFSGPLVKWPDGTMAASVEWLRKQLQTLGIAVHPNCGLAWSLRRLDVLQGMLATHANIPFGGRDEFVNFFIEGDGADFLSKTLHRGTLAGLALDRGRWRQLVCGNPIPTMKATQSNERDHVWETVLAAVMATFCQNVQFAEPDVTGDFDGRRFGVAAKVAYSNEKLWPNVEKGAAQGDGLSSASVVFVNVVNLLPVAEVYEATRAFSTNQEVSDFVKSWADGWCQQAQARAFAAEWSRKAKNPVGVAFFMPLLVHAVIQPVPCYYVSMPLVWSEDPSPDYEFARAFLQSCNTILGFRPTSGKEQSA